MSCHRLFTNREILPFLFSWLLLTERLSETPILFICVWGSVTPMESGSLKLKMARPSWREKLKRNSTMDKATTPKSIPVTLVGTTKAVRSTSSSIPNRRCCTTRGTTPPWRAGWTVTRLSPWWLRTLLSGPKRKTDWFCHKIRLENLIQTHYTNYFSLLFYFYFLSSIVISFFKVYFHFYNQTQILSYM